MQEVLNEERMEEIITCVENVAALLFESGVSKSKADESDLADNAESVPTSASSDQP